MAHAHLQRNPLTKLHTTITLERHSLLVYSFILTALLYKTFQWKLLMHILNWMFRSPTNWLDFECEQFWSPNHPSSPFFIITGVSSHPSWMLWCIFSFSSTEACAILLYRLNGDFSVDQWGYILKVDKNYEVIILKVITAPEVKVLDKVPPAPRLSPVAVTGGVVLPHLRGIVPQ